MEPIENTIEDYKKFVGDKIYDKHKENTKDCISFGKILKASEIGKSILSLLEINHLKECSKCHKKLKELQPIELLAEITRSSLLSKNNDDELTDITSDLLENKLFADTAIVCTKGQNGYNVCIESDTLILLLMIFLKDGKELFKTKISKETLAQVPLDKIKNWTDIRFLDVANTK